MIEKSLSYYRTSLADGERMAPRLPKNPITIEHITDITFKRVHGYYKTKDARSYDIIASPFRITRKAFSGQKKINDIFPFWIPLRLSEQSGLLPPANESLVPWFIRGVLEPNNLSYSYYPALASVAKLDEELSLFQWDRSDLGTYLKQAKTYFEKVNGKSWDQLALDGWVLDIENWTVIKADPKGMAANISGLYEYLAQKDNLPPLLNTVLDFSPSTPESIDDLDLAFATMSHKGQMSGEYPLATSQRASIVGFSRLKKGDILAVNGPPGTGKTTLLQSAFGHAIVQSALKEKEAPEPARILACSMNNQAITNILDSCQNIPTTPGLFERWLPELPSFGTYLTNKLEGDKLKTALEKGYLPLSKVQGNPPLHGWYNDYIEAHSPEECMDYFRSRFNKYFGKKALSADQMLTLLKKEIKQRQRKIEQYLETVKFLKDMGVDDNVADNIKKEQEELENQEEQIRTHLRTCSIVLQKVQDMQPKKTLLNKALSIILPEKNNLQEKLASILECIDLPDDLSLNPTDTFDVRLQSKIIDLDVRLKKGVEIDNSN